MADAVQSEELSPVDAFLETARSELELTRSQLKEVGMLVEQSQGEVEKLAQRNAAITAQLHQLQAHFDTVPREDIRSSYEAAQDAQQRLFTMRGQLEKLQSDQVHMKRYVDHLARTVQLLEGGAEPAEGVTTAVSTIGIEQIIDAQEEERRRISRQIHDGPAQALSNFILQAEIAMRLFDIDQKKAKEELASLKATATSTFANVRDFIFDLRPMMLDDLGLVPTVRRYVEAYKEKHGLNVTMVMTGTERRLETHREVLTFRAIQELLANVREHAQATSVKLVLDLDANQIRSMVEDNGKGFDKVAVLSDQQTGRGLRTLSERLQQIGGTVEIESTPGNGTRVSFSIPLSK